MLEAEPRLKKYYDHNNFPYGFHKSGEFSIAEAKELEDKGHQLSRLEAGEVEAKTADEKRFVLVMSGALQASTKLEKLWLKYRRLCTKGYQPLRPASRSGPIAAAEIDSHL